MVWGTNSTKIQDICTSLNTTSHSLTAEGARDDQPEKNLASGMSIKNHYIHFRLTSCDLYFRNLKITHGCPAEWMDGWPWLWLWLLTSSHLSPLFFFGGRWSSADHDVAPQRFDLARGQSITGTTSRDLKLQAHGARWCLVTTCFLASLLTWTLI